MLHATLFNSIKSRLVGDTTLLSELRGPFVFDAFASANQEMPFVVVTFADSFADDAFRSNVIETTVRVALYVDRSGGDNIGNHVQRSATIGHRVYGNSYASSDFAPSFGLHRWTPTGLSEVGWSSAGPMVFRRSYEFPEEGYFQFIQEYAHRAYQVYTVPTP